MNRTLKSILCKVGYSPLGDKLVWSSGLGYLWLWLHVHSSKKRLLADAMKKFHNGANIGNFDDYKESLDNHWVSYQEYAHQYKFPEKSETQRYEYVSRLRMAYFYWRYTPSAAKQVFREKKIFLRVFGNYIHRQWLYVPEASFEDFEKMITQFDCIVKPYDGKLGQGIFKVYHNSDHTNDLTLYEECKKNRMLLEECIEACDELKVLHPQSLNTIRVVTVNGRDKACVISGVLRTGVGDSVVDNSHAGGVSAQINVSTGIVETDGTDTKGNKYEYHPDSGIKFVGYTVHNWNAIVETCCEAAKLTNAPMTGWDVVVNNHGYVEFVEANYGPDMDMMQTRYKTGAKKKIHALIKEYCGIELK